MKYIEAVQNVVLTLWVGGMCAIGYLSAPVIFSVLDNRQLAGQVAGKQFELIAWVGIVCGVILLVSTLYRLGRVWQVWVLVLMLLLVFTGLFWIQPMMQELKATGLVPGSSQAAQFGRMHGLSSILYLITSGLGLLLVIRSLRA